MKIKIRYLMTFSQLSGIRHEELDVPDSATLRYLIILVKKSKSKEFRRYLEDSLKNNTVAFLVNKSVAEEDVKLKPGDEVIISHVVGGG